MDSVGILDGKAIAIEVKPAVTARMVWHRAEASGSIEAKIAATLRALEAPPPWLSTFQTAWDGSTYPMIVILAERFSEDGLAELFAMLNQRAAEWPFAYEIWRWTGTQVETLASNAAATADLRRARDVSIPTLVGSASRPAPPTVEEFLALASGNGVGPILTAFIDAARQHRLRIVRKVSGIGIGGRGGGAEWATAFITDCNALTGLNVGVDLAPLGIAEADLPGTPAPKRGHMGCNRWIRTPTEASGLISLIIDRRR